MRASRLWANSEPGCRASLSRYMGLGKEFIVEVNLLENRR